MKISYINVFSGEAKSISNFLISGSKFDAIIATKDMGCFLFGCIIIEGIIHCRIVFKDAIII